MISLIMTPNMIPSNPSSDDLFIDPIATDLIFDLIRDLAHSLTIQLEPSEEYGNTLSDDSCDDLDATLTMIDYCSRALRSDERDDACDLLIDALERNDARHPNKFRPNDFDLIEQEFPLAMIPHLSDATIQSPAFSVIFAD